MRITGTLREYVLTFMTISCSIIARMRNVLDKICTENRKHIFCFIIPPPPGNLVLYEIMSENIVEPERPQ